MTNDDPDEIITVAYCSRCENLMQAGRIQEAQGKPRCPWCASILNAEDFYDYCDIRVVDYGV